MSRRATAPGTNTARLAAAVLALEAFLVLFATLVAQTMSSLPTAAVWTGGGGLALACLLLAGLTRRRAGLVAGTVMQGVLVATGVWVPAMYVLGVLFAALWFWLVALGARADRGRARLESGG